MTLDKALQIAKELAAGHRRWGKVMNPPYTAMQMAEAIAVLDANGHFESNVGEELTRVKRQLAACQNREKARKAKGGEPPSEETP